MSSISPLIRMTPATRRLACSLLAAGFLACTLGCPEPKARPTKRRSAARSGGQQSALFNSIRSQLRSVPDWAQLELSPPVVVLDARRSKDGEDIEAVLLRQNGVPEGGPANRIRVLRENATFRSLVKPGDILKFYGEADREMRDRLEAGEDVFIETFDAWDMTVAQVLSDNELLVEQAFGEYTVPRKIEVWRIADDRMEEIQRQWGAYATRREPPLAWHPSPDEAAIGQLTERLNQWLRQTRFAGKKAEGKETPRPALLGTLPESLAEAEKLLPYLAAADLATGFFRPYEVRQIEGALWRRDVARWARGADTAPLSVAESLFDWTVRNLQLIGPEDAPPRWPWELMLQGRATAKGRAWVFAGLCEQQKVPVAVVTVPVEGGERTLVGVVDDDALRLFDPALGLPIPGAEPGQVATLAEARADDAVLRRLDLPEQPYPVRSESLAEARIDLVASPLALTRRAAALTKGLAADEAFVLAVDPEALAKQIAPAAGEAEVGLWPGPFQTLLDKLTAKRSQRNRAVRDFLPFAWRPHLWRARCLHFRGLKGDPDEERTVMDDAIDDHRNAMKGYMNRRVRPKDERIQREPDSKQSIYRQAKALATIGLATLTYERGSYRVSKDWIENRALEGAELEPFRPMVLYNRARAYEQLGDTPKAIELLGRIEGPMAHGAKLLANEWGERPDESTEAPDTPETTEASSE
ncbi:hypothetical protein MalM25_27280 [Planctomycetes bacterium MalM25]|nr:hypothetical protein MalM25_27280 [Planctomycetes bacterium MalM25]